MRRLGRSVDFGSARFSGAVRGRQPRLRGHRIRNRRRAPAPVAGAARQCRTPDDDRRTDRRGRGSQYRARRTCCGARTGGAAHSGAGRKPGARYPLAGSDVEWLLAAAAGSSRHAGATSCAGAAWTAHRADVRGADQRRAAACRTDSSPATRGVDRARRRSFRRGPARCAGYAAAAAQPSRAADPIAAGRTTQRTSR